MRSFSVKAIDIIPDWMYNINRVGRKVFDELQLGSGVMNRKFTYLAGEITQAHEDANKRKSDAETTLVEEIVFANGRTIQYDYDNEERITKVIDSGIYMIKDLAASVA